MATKMTANGVSTTTTPSTEQYEIFYNARRPRRKHYMYDYRHTDGDLFSCVAPTLKECRLPLRVCRRREHIYVGHPRRCWQL